MMLAARERRACSRAPGVPFAPAETVELSKHSVNSLLQVRHGHQINFYPDQCSRRHIVGKLACDED
jgi:hypothetical protein